MDRIYLGRFMRFLSKAFTGLFIASITLAIAVLALNSIRTAVQAKMDEEPRSRPQREQTFTVNVVEYTPQDIEPIMTVFGTVQSGRTLELRTTLGGQITFLADNFVEGGYVTAGQTLLRTDNSDETTAVERSQLELAVAQATVAEAEQTLIFTQRDFDVTEKQTNLQKQALVRQQDLVSRGVSTTAATESAEISAAAAEQSLLTKERAVSQAQADLAQAKNQLGLAQLANNEARRALEQTELEAEFSGVLSGVSAVSGGLVSANEQVGSLIDPNRLEIEFRVSNSQYAQLTDADSNLTGTPISAVLTAQNFRQEASGTITRESAIVEAGQTGRLLYARLENQDTALFKPGDFVTVNVTEPMLSDVAEIPNTAVDAGQMVLVLNDQNRLESKDVIVLRRQGNSVIIKAPDLVGLQIVSERTPLLGDGILVSPRDPNAPTERPARPTTPEAAQTTNAKDITLTDDRRAKLIAAVEANRRMPDEAKTRILNALQNETVPAQMVERIESRMGRGG